MLSVCFRLIQPARYRGGGGGGAVCLLLADSTSEEGGGGGGVAVRFWPIQSEGGGGIIQFQWGEGAHTGCLR